MPVRKLPPEVIRRIAAGEVVDTPASVVRELVENALDAGARRIEVELLEGGRDRIVVEDDGEGIPAEDLPKVVERYTTSKIATPEDLFQIRTLGFRGEALHAIASVARVVIRTRYRDEDVGWYARFEQARLVERKPDPLPRGTRVEVQDLFWDFPARRNFLKRAATERRRVLEEVTAYALCHPEVAFRVREGDEVLLDLPARGDLASRLADLLGPEVLETLKPVVLEAGDVAIHMWVSPAEHASPSRPEQWIFLNGRPIRDETLRSTVYQALRLPPGRHPRFLMYLTVDPRRVDFHVHPQKREVRFARDLNLRGLLYRELQGFSGGGETLDEETPPDHLPWEVPEPVSEAVRETLPPLWTETRESFHFLQVFGTYLVFEREGELWVMDQHAAHERVLYEKLLQEPPASRPLLFPMILHLPPHLAARMEEHRAVLEQAGFRFRKFGPGKVVVDALPVFLEGADRETLRAFLEEVEQEGGWSRTDRMLKTLACKAAIRAGDPIQPDEARRLLRDLLACEVPHFCPHGRPVIWRISREELDERFGRT